MKSIFKINVNILIVFTLFIFVNCAKEQNDDNFFRSDFNSSEPRTFIGPEYWANPMQDWQVAKGKLECLVSKKNRNVHLLTRKIDSIQGDVKMSVNLEVFNTEISDNGTNWIGFSIGSKGEFNDYRDNAIFGKGLNVGVTTAGNLFIGQFSQSRNVDSNIVEAIKKGVSLKVEITPGTENYQLTVSLFNNSTKQEIQSLSKTGILSEDLIGDVVLVSNFISNQNTKSVAFSNWELSGSKISSHPNFEFGPILFSQYTLSKGTLKITAQMAPVSLNGEKVYLQIKENNVWETIQSESIDKDARTATFKTPDWNTNEDIPYRLTYQLDKGKSKHKKEYYWGGVIRKDPIDKEEIVVAGFTGNSDLGFPNSDIFNQVEYHNPDVLFFSGDQIYETVGGYGTQRFPTETAMLDYLRKWYVYGWAYRDLMKDRPTVSITDDHDVYHGNIWGEGGKHSPTKKRGGSAGQDAGGYMMPAEWVKMVERTQTSHLPYPYNNKPIEQGIGTYYTDMVYGGVSFAILEDRKFKSAPKALLPKAEIKNGWAMNKSFDMQKDGDVKDASLLGVEQLAFLNHWVSDWSYQSEMKMLLSQTIFANVATLPKEAMSGEIISKLRIMEKGDYPPNDRPVADLDSNGWPQSGRDEAVKIIRKGFTFHLAGDQHLGSTVQYGVKEWNDSGFALCVPSISNYWPRRWYPSKEGKNRDINNPRYTGEFKDGFGNKMSVHAVSNPTFTGKKPSRLYDRATGYGIVRMNKSKRDITLECWPRMAKPELGNSEQYEGWPIIINQEDNYGREAIAYLPEIEIYGINKPVVQIINEKNNEIVYSIRLNRNNFKPKIFDASASYTVKVGEPDSKVWQSIKSITPSNEKIQIKF
ncbi:alkaline phosphatase D family protein [Bacteroidota bacterium]